MMFHLSFHCNNTSVHQVLVLSSKHVADVVLVVAGLVVVVESQILRHNLDVVVAVAVAVAAAVDNIELAVVVDKLAVAVAVV